MQSKKYFKGSIVRASADYPENQDWTKLGTSGGMPAWGNVEHHGTMGVLPRMEATTPAVSCSLAGNSANVLCKRNDYAS